MRVTVADFFCQARLGDLAIGASRAGVLDALGVPDDTSIQRRPIEIVKYGNVQLHLKADRVMLIDVSLWSRQMPVHRAIELDGWDALWECDVAGFEAVINTVGAPCHENPALTLGTQQAFLIGTAGVGAVFADRMIDHVDLHESTVNLPRR